MALNPPYNVRCPHGTGLTSDLFAGLKADQRRYAAYLKLRADARLLFSIDFGQAYSRFEQFRSACKCRRHRLARPAPWCPEIHDQGNVVAVQVTLESSLRERQGRSGKERLVAPSASRPVTQSMLGNAIGGIAMWAHDIEQLTH